ncbi:hypothetical protein L228DRAFT_245664 [Xylona heveae TC161]|uniref:Uncharacterized protein n=1 Tax=Xylona heveae (strain CBS 132557 / TC161) TaxID=1328760 RepID=A0A161TQN0_XYLHT|nr:hypothetical protein L228DRAFT_245664 [Xylona heveae TC161]KZF24676.1 hypothetical protein L228DRAFT_245664 [Xylona heveae TC161]
MDHGSRLHLGYTAHAERLNRSPASESKCGYMDLCQVFEESRDLLESLRRQWFYRCCS